MDYQQRDAQPQPNNVSVFSSLGLQWVGRAQIMFGFGIGRPDAGHQSNSHPEETAQLGLSFLWENPVCDAHG
jgi:hypothetical protein